MAGKGLTEQNTKGKDDGSDDAPATVTIHGREMEVRSPGSGSLAMFTAAMNLKNPGEQISRVMDFVIRRLPNEEDREWLQESMMEDEVSMEDVMDALEEMMEAWSEDPTIASSDSSGSSTNTGARSTRATRRAT